MRKFLILLFLLLLPNLVFASLDQSLYYGMTKSNDVKVLQQYLIQKGFLTGQATGNFFSLTQIALKKYQASRGILQTGSAGPLTRKAINQDLLTTTIANPMPSPSALTILPSPSPSPLPTPSPDPSPSVTPIPSSLAVSKDSSAAPLSAMVAMNQRVAVGAFLFSATSDTYTITNLKFVIPGSAGASLISGVLLSNTTTKALLTPKPIKVFYDGRNGAVDAPVSILVTANTSVSVTVSYDLVSTITALDTNTDMSLALTYVKATTSKGVIDGVASNYQTMLTLNNEIVLPSVGVTVNPLYLFKSIPTFSLNVSGATAINNSKNDLYDFTVAASPNGDISIKQLMFTIALTDPNNTNPSATDFTLFKDGKDVTGSVLIGSVANGNFVNLSTANGIGTGTTSVIVLFIQEETIPANKTQAYTLKARLNRFSSTTAGVTSISISLPLDSTSLPGPSRLHTATSLYYQLTQDPQNFTGVSYNVLWSDRSSPFPNFHNNLNGSYTNDWYSGFGIKNLPLATQTITAK